MSWDRDFPGVAYFGEGCYVLSCTLFPTQEDATWELENYLKEKFDDPEYTVNPKRLIQTTAVYRRAKEEEIPHNGHWKPGDLMWLLGESGPRAKKVWLYEA